MKNYKMLLPEFDKYGFHFKELVGDGDYKIYEKTKGHYKGYEVCRTKFYDEYEIAGVTVEASQSLPGNEQWGIDAFSFMLHEYPKALEKLVWMQTKQFGSVPQTIDSAGVLIKRKPGRPRKQIKSDNL